MEQAYVPSTLGRFCTFQESPLHWSLFGSTPLGFSYWMIGYCPPFELWTLITAKENKQINDWEKKIPEEAWGVSLGTKGS
jgi:hypothetical protein